MSSEKKTKTQKISTAQNKNATTVTSFFTRIFHQTNTDVMSLYREDSDIQNGSDDGKLHEIEQKLSLSNIHDLYEIRKEIAAGGQGTIYKAYDKIIHRTIAVKSLNQNLQENEKARTAFFREAVLTGKLEHPAIVPVYGIFNDQEKGLHLAMKLIKGRTLKDYLKILFSKYRIISKSEVRKHEAILLSQKMEFFLRVCSAVSFLHKNNIVHRDLKPENIMIGDFNETYIMDLGIAISNEDKDSGELPAGTPQYIAPEVISGEPYDHRSDIFLLGLILYELLCISPAYEQLSMEESILQARRGKIREIRHAFGCEIQPDLQWIIRKATSRNPEDRYQSAEDLSDDIHAFLTLRPVKANPHTVFGFLRCFLMRRYKLLIGIALIALLLFFSSLGYVYQKSAREAEEQRASLVASAKITSNGVLKVSSLNDRIRYFETIVSQLAEEAAVRLEMNGSGNPSEKLYTPSDPPAGVVESPAYRIKIHLDHPLYIYQGRENGLPSARKLSPMKESFLRAITDSISSNVNLTKEERKFKLMYQKQAPFQRVYIGLRSGIFMVYPFVDGYSESYDPRKRPWFGAAMEVNRTQCAWSQPYEDAASGERLITCSKKIISTKTGAFLGVVGADISFESLAEIVQYQNRPLALLETFLMDDQGKLILRTDEVSGTAEMPNENFSNRLVLRAMQLTVCGQFRSVENGKSVLYFFMKVPSLNWIYAERYDYQKILDKLNHGL